MGQSGSIATGNATLLGRVLASAPLPSPPHPLAAPVPPRVLLLAQLVVLEHILNKKAKQCGKCRLASISFDIPIKRHPQQKEDRAGRRGEGRGTATVPVRADKCSLI